MENRGGVQFQITFDRCLRRAALPGLDTPPGRAAILAACGLEARTPEAPPRREPAQQGAPQNPLLGGGGPKGRGGFLS